MTGTVFAHHATRAGARLETDPPCTPGNCRMYRTRGLRKMARQSFVTSMTMSAISHSSGVCETKNSR